MTLPFFALLAVVAITVTRASIAEGFRAFCEIINEIAVIDCRLGGVV